MWATVEQVAPRPTDQDVRATLPEEPVVAAAAFETIDLEQAAAAFEHIPAAVPRQRVVAALTGDRVVAGPSADDVAAAPAADAIVAAEADDHVGSLGSPDPVGARRTDDRGPLPLAPWRGRVNWRGRPCGERNHGQRQHDTRGPRAR